MDKPADNCCRWIYGDVRDGTATWCDVPALGGGPWCRAHRGIVYVACRPRTGGRDTRGSDPSTVAAVDEGEGAHHGLPIQPDTALEPGAESKDDHG